MSLEDRLKENTEALQALTKAIVAVGLNVHAGYARNTDDSRPATKPVEHPKAEPPEEVPHRDTEPVTYKAIQAEVQKVVAQKADGRALVLEAVSKFTDKDGKPLAAKGANGWAGGIQKAQEKDYPALLAAVKELL